MKKTPKKPRNYAATDITRIQLHAMKKQIAALKASIRQLKARLDSFY